MKGHEQQIVSALANEVRVLSLEQIARTWWSDTRWGRSRTKAVIRQLEVEGWVQIHRSLSRPIRQLHEPVATWRPSDANPDFACLSCLLRRRAKAAASMTTFVFANAKGIAMFGCGRAPSVKLTQMTHDLHVAEVFLDYRTNGLQAQSWLSEDRLPSDWPLRNRPDALLVNDEGNYRRAVEYGGNYPPSRLEELHDGLASIDLPYEIW